MTTPSNTYKPFMAYLDQRDYARLKKLSKATKVPMAQLIREGVSARLSSNDYNKGYNAGLQKAVDVVGQMEISQIRFPSGKSIAELVETTMFDFFVQEGKDDENDSAG